MVCSINFIFKTLELLNSDWELVVNDLKQKLASEQENSASLTKELERLRLENEYLKTQNEKLTDFKFMLDEKFVITPDKFTKIMQEVVGIMKNR